MKKGIFMSLILLLVSSFSLAGQGLSTQSFMGVFMYYGNGSSVPGFGAPIDEYQVGLIVLAVLLTVGAIVYRKLSLKKA